MPDPQLLWTPRYMIDSGAKESHFIFQQLPQIVFLIACSSVPVFWFGVRSFYIRKHTVLETISPRWIKPVLGYLLVAMIVCYTAFRALDVLLTWEPAIIQCIAAAMVGFLIPDRYFAWHFTTNKVEELKDNIWFQILYTERMNAIIINLKNNLTAIDNEIERTIGKEAELIFGMGRLCQRYATALSTSLANLKALTERDDVLQINCLGTRVKLMMRLRGHLRFIHEIDRSCRDRQDDRESFVPLRQLVGGIVREHREDAILTLYRHHCASILERRQRHLLSAETAIGHLRGDLTYVSRKCDEDSVLHARSLMDNRNLSIFAAVLIIEFGNAEVVSALNRMHESPHAQIPTLVFREPEPQNPDKPPVTDADSA